MNSKTSIAWFDLTFKIHSIFGRKENIILNRLEGSANFGTLTAIMGPSGAGLTSLLKCLNGMNESNLDKETEIRLSSVQKIRSTFVGHNEKEFLVMGLTAKQNMIYASKLKNSNYDEDIDHEMNINQIMTDLLISDTINTKAENCSGGEQKRLAIALELTAIKKPNLIFCDEPTTGLDSNVAEVVVQCLKKLSLKQNISIITTIHQPNSEILQMIDKLYVLAKGGVCVYSGTPEYLPIHLRQCDIVCNAYQVPIEYLVTIASKEIEDKSVYRLRDKTYQNLNEMKENILNETQLKKIKRKNKSFSFKDIHILLSRALTEFRFYEWKAYLMRVIVLTLTSYVVTISFDKYVGKANDCLTLGLMDFRSCFEILVSQNSVERNIMLIYGFLWILQMAQCVISSTAIAVRYKIFKNEHQNTWYSAGSYYITQTIIDLIPTTIYAIITGCILFFLSHQLNESKRFWAFIYSNILAMHLVESLVYFCTFVIPDIDLAISVSFALVLTGCIFSGFVIRINDMKSMMKFFSHFTPMKFILNSQMIAIFGMDRCSHNQTSKTLIEFDLGDNDFSQNTLYAWTQLISYRIIALIVLIVIKNPKYFNYFLNYLKFKFLNQTNTELELKPILRSNQRNVCYDNQIEINLEEEGKEGDDDISEYYSVCENDSQLYEEIDLNNKLSIAWIDMTLKVEKTLYSKEKLILRGISGCAQFGTLTALMGPSGAGKTSLLRCLNGMYRNLMTKESKIYLSNTRKIRTSFIAQDQREHIIKGLTVRQTLIYASKLKNTGKQIDHEHNVIKLMNELAINDIKGVNVEKCSSGQQKRIVMAMELTAKNKPNLICVDEPTSGVDSYSALLMINCFRNVSERHNLSIITSIHQPNLEILMKFDKLYVLAKGGLTMFSGRPQQLRNHLNECQINCTENQIPIEILMKIGANGYNDESVIRLSEKTNQNQMTFDKRVANDLKFFADGIPQRTKRFTFEELKHLMMRSVTYTLKYNWIIIVGILLVNTIYSILALILFDLDVERPDGCISLSNNSTNGCLKTLRDIEDSKLLQYNCTFLTICFVVPSVLILFNTVLSFASEIKIFINEYRNYWYSVESYFVVKTLIGMICGLSSALLVSSILNFYERDDIYGPILLVNILTFLTSGFFGHTIATCFDENSTAAVVVAIVYHVLFCDTLIPTHEFGKFIRRLGSLDSPGTSAKYLLYKFYGNKCTDNQLSSIFYKYSVVEDDFDKSMNLLIFTFMFYLILSYIVLKIKANKSLLEIKFKELMDKMKSNM